MARRATAASVGAGEWLPEAVALPPGGGDADAAAARLVRVYKALPADRAEAYLALPRGGDRRRPLRPGRRRRYLDDVGPRARAARRRHDDRRPHRHPPAAGARPAGAPARGGRRLRRAAAGGAGEPMRWFSYPVGSPDAFTAQDARAARAARCRAGLQLLRRLRRRQKRSTASTCRGSTSARRWTRSGCVPRCGFRSCSRGRTDPFFTCGRTFSSVQV